jgi:hypothetical protein
MMSSSQDDHVEAIRILNLEGIRPQTFEKGSTMVTLNVLNVLVVEEPGDRETRTQNECLRRELHV